MLDLANKIIDLCESDSKVIHKELPADDPKVRRPDITLAREKLGWEAKIPADEGLRRTHEYFVEALKARESGG